MDVVARARTRKPCQARTGRAELRTHAIFFFPLPTKCASSTGGKRQRALWRAPWGWGTSVRTFTQKLLASFTSLLQESGTLRENEEKVATLVALRASLLATFPSVGKIHDIFASVL